MPDSSVSRFLLQRPCGIHLRRNCIEVVVECFKYIGGVLYWSSLCICELNVFRRWPRLFPLEEAPYRLLLSSSCDSIRKEDIFSLSHRTILFLSASDLDDLKVTLASEHVSVHHPGRGFDCTIMECLSYASAIMAEAAVTLLAPLKISIDSSMKCS
jgi:hypothetical protein